MTTFVRKREDTKWHVAGDIPPRRSSVGAGEAGLYCSTTCSSRYTYFPQYTHIPDDASLALKAESLGTAIRSGDQMCHTCAINCHDDVVPELFARLGGVDPRPNEPVRPVAGVWVTANRTITGFPVTIHFRVHDQEGWHPRVRDDFVEELEHAIQPVLELLANKHNVSVRDIR